MTPQRAADLYSPSEIARAAGVPLEQVLGALRDARANVRGARFVPHADAVRIGRALVGIDDGGLMLRPAGGPPLFSLFARPAGAVRSRPVFAVSGTLHAALVAGILAFATLNVAPEVSMLHAASQPASVQLVYLTTPGPGGGGGGGGLEQPAPPPKAQREGRHSISSPIAAAPPVHIAPPQRPAPRDEPPPPVVAPVATIAADARTRPGVAEETRSDAASSGPGTGGGVGTGAGTGVGSGSGSGIGPGTGGGTGGGPYRPGSGINPPRLLKEVKADYTEEARHLGISGEVVLEIVVRRDGSVGDVKILQGLGGGLNDRAIQSVRQWRFAPAERLGAPVDVYVEVAVEFRQR